MNNIFDSHIHFNMKADNPVDDFKRVVSILDGFILILNTKEEKTLFKEEFSKNFKTDYPLSAVVFSYELYERNLTENLITQNIKVGVKLHPRLSNIKKNDFDKVIYKLEEQKFDFIIVDCFYYGSNLDNHINLELAVYIAKFFQNTKVLLAHGGGHKVLEYMLYTRDLKNVYYDFSFTAAYLKDTSSWIDLIKFFKFNEQKILFGSDYPEFEVYYIKSCYDEIIQKSLNKNNSKFIEYANYKKFMEIE
ncbi:MAG: amidohydrolase family protein [Campylobacterota bacterium]|nr:amidohydrolase family protein [Campylobacterota bacterium]